MTIKGRLGKLEDIAPANHPYKGAKEQLLARFDRADPETRERLLRAISERLEHRD